MSMVRLLHLPWSPLLATAVVLWVVAEPLLARKSTIFPLAPRASQIAGGETAIDVKRTRAGGAERLTNFSFAHPVTL